MHTIQVTMTFNTAEEVLAFFSEKQGNPIPSFDVPAPAPAPHLSPFHTVMVMLNDDRFEYRKLSTLANDSGVSTNEVLELLNKEGVSYETATKRGTGEALIKLS